MCYSLKGNYQKKKKKKKKKKMKTYIWLPISSEFAINCLMDQIGDFLLQVKYLYGLFF